MCAIIHSKYYKKCHSRRPFSVWKEGVNLWMQIILLPFDLMMMTEINSHAWMLCIVVYKCFSITTTSISVLFMIFSADNFADHHIWLLLWLCYCCWGMWEHHTHECCICSTFSWKENFPSKVKWHSMTCQKQFEIKKKKKGLLRLVVVLKVYRVRDEWIYASCYY